MVDGVKCGPDGIRCDVNGNLWVSSNAGRAVGYSGVTVWSPEGKLLGRIRTARGGRQHLLRRPQAQPAVHGGKPVALRGLRRRRRVRHPAEGAHLAIDRHVGDFFADCLQQNFSPTLRNAPGDENNSAATVFGWPAIEPGGRMKDMLDAMDHRRPVGAFENVHDALETEDVGAAVLGERFEERASAPQPGSASRRTIA